MIKIFLRIFSLRVYLVPWSNKISITNQCRDAFSDESVNWSSFDNPYRRCDICADSDRYGWACAPLNVNYSESACHKLNSRMAFDCCERVSHAGWVYVAVHSVYHTIDTRMACFQYAVSYAMPGTVLFEISCHSPCTRMAFPRYVFLCVHQAPAHWRNTVHTRYINRSSFDYGIWCVFAV